MKPWTRNLSFSLVTLIFAILACNLPGATAPTPFVFPTPNLTMTALFDPTRLPEATITLLPPLIQTATTAPGGGQTPSPAATATPEPSPLPSDTLSPPVPTHTLTNTVVPTQSFAGPGMRPEYGVSAVYLSTPPSIDGRLADWGLEAYIVQDVVYGAAQHAGLADLSASMMVGWDETYLYIGVEVTDDVYVQNASGVELFKGDSIEMLLDTDVSGDFYLTRLNEDDFQLGISPGSPLPGDNPEAYLWYPASLEGRRTNLIIAAQAVETGYQIEAAIPWSLFGITPHEGRHFGFALSVSDNDVAGDKVQQNMVSNVPTRALTDPTTWGNLTLVKP